MSEISKIKDFINMNVRRFSNNPSSNPNNSGFNYNQNKASNYIKNYDNKSKILNDDLKSVLVSDFDLEKNSKNNENKDFEDYLEDIIKIYYDLESYGLLKKIVEKISYIIENAKKETLEKCFFKLPNLYCNYRKSPVNNNFTYCILIEEIKNELPQLLGVIEINSHCLIDIICILQIRLHLKLFSNSQSKSFKVNFISDEIFDYVENNKNKSNYQFNLNAKVNKNLDSNSNSTITNTKIIPYNNNDNKNNNNTTTNKHDLINIIRSNSIKKKTIYSENDINLVIKEIVTYNNDDFNIKPVVKINKVVDIPSKIQQQTQTLKGQEYKIKFFDNYSTAYDSFNFSNIYSTKRFVEKAFISTCEGFNNKIISNNYYEEVVFFNNQNEINSHLNMKIMKLNECIDVIKDNLIKKKILNFFNKLNLKEVTINKSFNSLKNWKIPNENEILGCIFNQDYDNHYCIEEKDKIILLSEIISHQIEKIKELIENSEILKLISTDALSKIFHLFKIIKTLIDRKLQFNIVNKIFNFKLRICLEEYHSLYCLIFIVLISNVKMSISNDKSLDSEVSCKRKNIIFLNKLREFAIYNKTSALTGKLEVQNCFNINDFKENFIKGNSFINTYEFDSIFEKFRDKGLLIKINQDHYKLV